MLDGGDESLRIAFVTANERKMTETMSCTNQLDERLTETQTRWTKGFIEAIDNGS